MLYSSHYQHGGLIRGVGLRHGSFSSSRLVSQAAVKSIDISSYRLMHKNSFSHRNHKTYIIAVVSPGSSQCLEAEEELAKLANSLKDESHIVLATLNALESSEHFSFCTSTLQVKAYPTILLYPEGSPGMLRFKGKEVTARGLVDALNGSFKATGNNRRVKLEAPLDVSQDEQGSTVRLISTDRQAISEAASRLKESTSSYWTSGKALFWSFVLIFGVSAFVWDRWLGDWWELRQLAERQAKRRAGQEYDDDTTEQDLMNLTYLDANKAIRETLEQQQQGERQRSEGTGQTSTSL
jgi:hypothetical protein